MAKYFHENGDTIETEGTRYTVTVSGIVMTKADISKWSSNAEKWIDNDILAGYYDGFKKVEVK